MSYWSYFKKNKDGWMLYRLKYDIISGKGV